MQIDENMDISSAFGGGAIESTLERFKSVNHYVTTENKIIPDSLAIFTIQKEKFTDSETVWLNSVYDGKDSEKAAEILQECIAINPNYIDSYAALFDVYYWSDKLREGLELIDKVQENSSSANEIADKISRARTIARNAGIKVHQLEKKEPLNTVASVK